MTRLPPPIRNTWAVVLAAGDGSRLSSLTTDATGIAVPKQFCSLAGGATLLQETLRRAHSVCGRERVTAIVAEHHRRWWRGALWALPDANVIVQPRNRGTANGVLLAALSIATRDPLARLVFLPSDHYVRDEARLSAALREAATVRLRAGELVLLGMEPEDTDPELGYVVPSGPSRPGELPRVSRFVEKPSTVVAADLIAPDGGTVYADRAYDAQRLRQHLAAHGLGDGIMRRGGRYRPLDQAAIDRNHALVPVRRNVERLFGTMKRSYRMGRMRAYSLARNAVDLCLFAIAFNLRRWHRIVTT
ncbi:MAG: transposase [Reyranella sp.]|nr:transposase [Reyranella sp.]